MKRYLIRVIKYAIYLVVLIWALYFLMGLLGYSEMTFAELLKTPRGYLLMPVVVTVFALLYPFFGFTKRTLDFDASKDVETVDKVMNLVGFRRVNSDPANLIYQGQTPIKRLFMLYEDTITVTTTDGISVIEGVRKGVIKAYLRMDIYHHKED